ncbi:uncharacterized protein DUF58 [Lysobacter ruishenii]|uniref:Uncharacterized protein DUF58 n=2 Tax=Aerolutibacter ruishenii TaxID=686800 RepID=A0A562LJY7_9GAMM|nr:uncharacterized protein DUF58 [Lysobacter ruishenii]
MAIAWSASCCGWCRCPEVGRVRLRRRPAPDRAAVSAMAGEGHRETAVTDAEGVVPSLQELVALRAVASGRHRARQGHHGASGPALSPLRGRGMEYAESREYIAGDDARHIDWRLTARSGRPHTKLFQAERERMTVVVADTAPGLYFGTRVRFKSVQAARAGAVAAWVAAAEGDRLCALRGSRREPPIAPAAGARGALRVLDALVRWYAQRPEDDEGLADALDRARRLLRPGSRLVVLADPASLANVPPERWPALGQHHEVIVLLLTDPLEQQPPAQSLPLQSGGQRIELDLGNPVQRRQWLARFADPVREALAGLPSRGIRVHALSTDAPSDAWLPLLGRPRPLVA